ncbi:MAG: hypothetical protein KTR26_02055 [Flammeovirgaceae bacterium]|nr:hypothetical protein [Flammeovirgaceae bacterium]
MSFAKFQEDFEKEGEKWSKKYDLMDEDQLLNLIKKGKWDLTYQIWFAIRIKGTVEKSAPVLLNVLLKRFTNFLHRNHCADALSLLVKIKDDQLKKRVIQLVNSVSLWTEKKPLTNWKVHIGN